MASAMLPTIASYAVGFAATVVLAAFFTPRSWWRRANARAIAVLAVGTFGIGSALSGFASPGQEAAAAPVAALPVRAGMPRAGAVYLAWDDLNLRAGRSVGARRLGVVPAGAQVTATGDQAGDWWEISARIGGREVRGWASSLWLRRTDEKRK